MTPRKRPRPGRAGLNFRGAVLVCGGRDFTDVEWLYRVLNQLHGEKRISLIVHGKAAGADAMAGTWAAAAGVICVAYPADWERHGRAAGPIRNQEMLDRELPELVVAFPTGGRGTADMMRRARAAGVKVLELKRERVP